MVPGVEPAVDMFPIFLSQATPHAVRFACPYRIVRAFQSNRARGTHDLGLTITAKPGKPTFILRMEEPCGIHAAACPTFLPKPCCVVGHLGEGLLGHVILPFLAKTDAVRQRLVPTLGGVWPRGERQRSRMCGTPGRVLLRTALILGHLASDIFHIDVANSLNEVLQCRLWECTCL